MDYLHMVAGLILASLFFLIGGFVSLGVGKRRQMWFSALLEIVGVTALIWAALLVLQH